MSGINIEDLEKSVENIVNEATEKRLKILENARKKAAEIMEKPIPVEEYEKEVEKIVHEAEKEAEEIVKRAEEKAEKLGELDPETREAVIKEILRVIAGVE